MKHVGKTVQYATTMGIVMKLMMVHIYVNVDLLTMGSIAKVSANISSTRKIRLEILF